MTNDKFKEVNTKYGTSDLIDLKDLIDINDLHIFINGFENITIDKKIT